MGKTFENVKGTYDYLPDKQIVREKIKATLQPIFVKYGFAPIETPILCTYELLASKYSEGADILNEIYKVRDQGRRQLGLRYDLTITFSKLVSSNPNITLPFKRYEIGRVYRDGPVKLGRNREFTQCDIDVVGTDSMMAEAEYMMMIKEAFDQLELEVEIEFNNRKLLVGIIYEVFGKLDENRLRRTIMLIDKFAKLDKSELIKEFQLINITQKQFEDLTDTLKLSYTQLKEKFAESDNELITEGLDEIGEMYEYLKGSAAMDCMIFTP
ncbi:MAG: ATP phosphoribosyltransferase regulatory subunit, partial [Clostridia bacterium]|nr:ATP phosphoribosyltransferase regulatory subunit [Clostridia bacterium]